VSDKNIPHTIDNALLLPDISVLPLYANMLYHSRSYAIMQSSYM